MPLKTGNGWDHNPVGVYLMSCYAYEVLNDSFITDYQFDKLGAYLHKVGEFMDHRHIDLIDLENCQHTSALTVPYHELPTIIVGATYQKLGKPFPNDFYEKQRYARDKALIDEFC